MFFHPAILCQISTSTSWVKFWSSNCHLRELWPFFCQDPPVKLLLLGIIPVTWRPDRIRQVCRGFVVVVVVVAGGGGGGGGGVLNRDLNGNPSKRGTFHLKNMMQRIWKVYSRWRYYSLFNEPLKNYHVTHGESGKWYGYPISVIGQLKMTHCLYGDLALLTRNPIYHWCGCF